VLRPDILASPAFTKQLENSSLETIQSAFLSLKLLADIWVYETAMILKNRAQKYMLELLPIVSRDFRDQVLFVGIGFQYNNSVVQSYDSLR